MPELIDQIGDYRGKAVKGAVSTTTNGYPQLVLELNGTSVYDGESSEWFDDAIDGNITAYLCLFGSKGLPTLAVQQVIDVTGWDGASFKGLNDLVKALIEGPGGLPIGFTVEESEWEGKTRLNVNWVRPYDAAPGRAIKECTPAELKTLDQQYARALQAVKGKTKATAPKPATGPKPPTQAALQTGVAGKQTATEAAVADISGSESSDAPSHATAPPTKPVAKSTVKGKSDKGRAWGALVKANKAEANAAKKTGGGASYDDGQLAEVWQATIAEVAGDVDSKQITREQWFEIKTALEAKVTIPF